jgi:secreted protein with Ig-like and vWFA domain
MRALASHLNESDVVTVVGFSRRPRLIADRWGGARAGELAGVVAATPSEGGTNLELALRAASEVAGAQFLEGAQNRVVLITDGAANLGDAAPESLRQLVVAMRQSGVGFDACGVGADGMNDSVLEALTRDGDGRYYMLDRPEDADEGFVRQMAGALRPAAKNVKVQVVFNPDRVKRYRLAGFEQHRLAAEDFRNDAVDAAELAAAEAGVALYHFEADPSGEGPVGTVFVRFQDVATGEMVERSWTVPYEARPPRLDEAAPALRLAAAAGLLAEKLKGGPTAGAVDLAELEQLAGGLRSDFGASERVTQLGSMVARARSLEGAGQ